jgi:hypothetical protein
MAKKSNRIWPPPVYVGVFADGETVRMSSMSTRTAAGELDFANGRRAVCRVRGNEQEQARSHPPPGASAEELAATGYFESIEYRRVLRHHAQRLVDEAVTELCGSPMPITIKRYKGYNRDGTVMRDGKGKTVWKTARIGYDSVPLFRSPLPVASPATDIVDGWAELAGETYPDPYFAPGASAEVIEMPRKRRVQFTPRKGSSVAGGPERGRACRSS